MKKKIDLFWYWFIFVVAFVLCFFAINNRKVDAYHLNENGNIVSDNIYNSKQYNSCFYAWNATCSIDNNTMYVSVNYTGENLSNVVRGYSVFTKNIFGLIEIGETYTFTLFFEDPDFIVPQFRLFDSVDTTYPGLSANVTNTNSITYTFTESNVGNRNVLYLGAYVVADTFPTYKLTGIMITKGSLVPNVFEPFGAVWYNESFVGDLATGVISYSSASLIYDNRDYGTSHSIADVSSYIDSSFGFIYFDRLWQYLDTLTSSEYENAWLTLQLNNKMNLNTTYILNAMFNSGNYGVGVKFYQGNNLILDVTNWINNNYAYCSETSGATCSVQLSNFVNVGDKPELQNSFTYFDKIEIWSGDTDKRTGSFGFQNISYNQGYNSGYNIGYSTGFSTGENTGYNNGYNSGYLYGYEKGVDAVEGTDNTLVGLVGGILTAPVNMLKTIFDFEFLGINLTHFIFSIVSLFIVIWLIKVFL